MPTKEDRKRAAIEYMKENDGGVKGSDLLDFLCDKFSEFSRKEHLLFITQDLSNQELDEEEEEREKIEASCSNCDAEAVGEEEVDEVFGFRNYQGRKYVQPWCRECR